MLEFILFALPWMADPTLTGSLPREVNPTITTCARPAAVVIESKSACASARTNQTERNTTNAWLTRWEIATQDLPDRNRSAREVFRSQIAEAFNEHTGAAAEQLVGRVTADQLNKVFHWRIVESDQEHVCLEAVPRDEFERLFYGSLRISLNSANGNPEELIVIGRNRVPRVVWQPDRVRTDKQIELVHFESDVPPAPVSFIRTADVRIE